MAIGGAEKVVSLLAREQRQHGAQVSILCLAHVGELGYELKESGFNIYAGKGTRLPSATKHAWRTIRMVHPQVVHCHNTAATVAVAPLARLLGVPRILTTRHGLVAPPHRLRSELKFAAAARFCDHIVGVSEATSANLRTIPLLQRAKVKCVLNAAAPMLTGSSINPTDSIRLLSVGRLSSPKDPETLIQAIALALNKVPSLELTLVGDGELRGAVEHEIEQCGLQGRVRVEGSRQQVSGYYANADIFVLSSKSEGLPIAVIEALSCGLPIVASAVGGIVDALRRTDGGVLVPPGDPRLLCDAVVRLANDAEERMRLGANGRRGYEDLFAPAVMHAAYEELYA